MDSFLDSANYLSLQTPNFSTSLAPWCAEDNLSDHSLLESPIYNDVATPSSTYFYLDSRNLTSNFNDHESNSMCLFDNSQFHDWLSDADQDLDISSPVNIAVASSMLPLPKYESINIHRQAPDFQLYPESFSSSASLSPVSGVDISGQFSEDLSLREAEVERLTAIAMGRLPEPVSSSPRPRPSHTSTRTEIAPRILSKVEGTASTQPTKSYHKRSGRRATANSPPPKSKSSRTSHNQVEKKYRTNLNSKIMQLRDCIPELQAQSSSESDEAENQEGYHVSKARILTAAIRFINALEKELEVQKMEVQRRDAID